MITVPTFSPALQRKELLFLGVHDENGDNEITIIKKMYDLINVAFKQ